VTTQVPKNIKIASRDKRIYASVGAIKGTPVRSYIDVSDKNFYLLEILDVLKDFNKIPDLDKGAAIKILSNKLVNLSPTETNQLVKYCLTYPPRVRAFLGALLEQTDSSIELATLKKSLNPLSEYNYGIKSSSLPTVKNWNLK